MVTTTFTASDFSSLNTAIEDIDATGADAATSTAYTIKVTGTIDLAVLEAINLDTGSSVTIEGMNSGGTSAQVQTINGQNLERGFFVYSGSVTLENLTLTNMTAVGGAGAGGGAGLGGGLFVASGGSAALVGVQFSNDSAIGGNGGASGFRSGGGGGGMGGQGGNTASGPSGGGGGGGIGIVAAGGAGGGANNGAAGIVLDTTAGGAG
ncbi:MAG: hypothetical protein WA268_13270, partial [Xanthobacteraceae bacterium]